MLTKVRNGNEEEMELNMRSTRIKNKIEFIKYLERHEVQLFFRGFFHGLVIKEIIFV